MRETYGVAAGEEMYTDYYFRMLGKRDKHVGSWWLFKHFKKKHVNTPCKWNKGMWEAENHFVKVLEIDGLEAEVEASSQVKGFISEK